MKGLIWIWVTGVLLVLCGCAGGGLTTDAATGSARTAVGSDIKLSGTPNGAEISSGPPLQVTYVGGLYQAGAVLPGQEGLDRLEQLAIWLKRNPQQGWQARVGAEGLPGGPAPEALAAKRLELLQRFLSRRGVETTGWEWQAAVGQGYQVQLVAKPASP